MDNLFGANIIDRKPVESPYQKIRELTKAEREEVSTLIDKLASEGKDAAFFFNLATAADLKAKRIVKHSALRNGRK